MLSYYNLLYYSGNQIWDTHTIEQRLPEHHEVQALIDAQILEDRQNLSRGEGIRDFCIRIFDLSIELRSFKAEHELTFTQYRRICENALLLDQLRR